MNYSRILRKLCSDELEDKSILEKGRSGPRDEQSEVKSQGMSFFMSKEVFIWFAVIGASDVGKTDWEHSWDSHFGSVATNPDTFVSGVI